MLKTLVGAIFLLLVAAACVGHGGPRPATPLVPPSTSGSDPGSPRLAVTLFDVTSTHNDVGVYTYNIRLHVAETRGKSGAWVNQIVFGLVGVGGVGTPVLNVHQRVGANANVDLMQAIFPCADSDCVFPVSASGEFSFGAAANASAASVSIAFTDDAGSPGTNVTSVVPVRRLNE